MEKLAAIDYGEKRVGLASTDESGSFALPREVLPNDEHLLSKIVSFLKEQGIQKVVIGESKNLKGEANPILEKAQRFGEELKREGFTIIFHPELYTSMEADRLQGRTPMRDASAAALILKSYIDSYHG